jgi:hypothetical protein
MEVKVLGRVRKLLEGLDAEPPGSSDEQIALTAQLEQLVAPGAAPFREITRMGRTFEVHTAAAIGAVVAIPTTAQMLALYNNEPDGGRSYVIDWVAATNVVSTAVASQAQLIANIGQLREAAPTDAALTIKKLNGMGTGNDTKARTILNATALSAEMGLAANWFPLGPSVGKPGVAGTPGYGLWAPVDGRIIVPPGRFFAMHVLANVVGETFLAYMAWHEVQLTLG